MPNAQKKSPLQEHHLVQPPIQYECENQCRRYLPETNIKALLSGTRAPQNIQQKYCES